MRIALLVLLLVGFDHARHDTVSKGAASCAQCHPTTKAGLLVGKPGHATCFGKCHGAPPPRLAPTRKPAIEPARLPVCLACHAKPALDGSDRAALAAMVPRTPDHALAIGHKRHAAVACATCHPSEARPTPGAPMAAHARCAGCHVGAPGKGPPMSLCTGCHPQGGKAPVLPDAHVHVGDAFSHAKHAVRGAKCATCHPGATETDDAELPHPTAQLCATAGCHDAKAAFSTTVACTRCHQELPAGKFDVARPSATFSHGTHLAYIAFVPCTTCHAVLKSGEIGVAGHAECTPCHEDDFGARSPTTCAACHDATEPWRKLPAIRPSLDSSEFGATLDHGRHAGACTGCHSLNTARVQLRPPRGHRACTGNGCHAPSSGAEPQLVNCAGCHELGLAARRRAQRESASWTVRQRFDHARHERSPDGSALACAACHVDMSGVDLLSVATPPKLSCAPCHDGATAFKLTGTGCTRCHLKPPKP